MKAWLLALLFATSVFAQAPANEDARQQRFKHVAEELRCLVCQNQTLADSNAGLAQDLRKEVYRMIDEGKSDQEIKEFLVARYGDFVLYRPRFTAQNIVLWVGPFVLLAIGALVIARLVRRSKDVASAAPAVSAEEAERVKKLLDERAS